jgi:hypothetical protein
MSIWAYYRLGRNVGSCGLTNYSNSYGALPRESLKGNHFNNVGSDIRRAEYMRLIHNTLKKVCTIKYDKLHKWYEAEIA